MSIEQVALGFIKVADESMCRPIRNLTEVNLIFQLYKTQNYFIL
jgi:hypothetical protein